MFLGVVNCEKVNIWGKLMEDKGYIARFVCADPSQCQLFVSSDNGCSLLGMGSTAFSQKGGILIESFPCICCISVTFSSK